MAERASPRRDLDRDGVWLPPAVFLLVCAMVVAAGPRILDDPDTYSHVAVGQWMIAHAAVPHRDVFSFSMRGMPWVPDEWLSEVALAWIHAQPWSNGKVGTFGTSYVGGTQHALACTRPPNLACMIPVDSVSNCGIAGIRHGGAFERSRSNTRRSRSALAGLSQKLCQKRMG